MEQLCAFCGRTFRVAHHVRGRRSVALMGSSASEETRAPLAITSTALRTRGTSSTTDPDRGSTTTRDDGYDAGLDQDRSPGGNPAPAPAQARWNAKTMSAATWDDLGPEARVCCMLSLRCKAFGRSLGEAGLQETQGTCHVADAAARRPRPGARRRRPPRPRPRARRRRLPASPTVDAELNWRHLTPPALPRPPPPQPGAAAAAGRPALPAEGSARRARDLPPRGVWADRTFLRAAAAAAAAAGVRLGFRRRVAQHRTRRTVATAEEAPRRAAPDAARAGELRRDGGLPPSARRSATAGHKASSATRRRAPRRATARAVLRDPRRRHGRPALQLPGRGAALAAGAGAGYSGDDPPRHLPLLAARRDPAPPSSAAEAARARSAAARRARWRATPRPALSRRLARDLSPPLAGPSPAARERPDHAGRAGRSASARSPRARGCRRRPCSTSALGHRRLRPEPTS